MKLHHGDLPGAALLNRVRASIAAALFPASIAPCSADPARVIHYPPAENLEHVVVELIDRPEHEIDQAAHVLTDWPAVQALARAAIGDVTSATRALLIVDRSMCPLDLVPLPLRCGARLGGGGRMVLESR